MTMSKIFPVWSQWNRMWCHLLELQQQLRDEIHSVSISVKSLNLKLHNFISALVSNKNTVGCSKKEATNLCPWNLDAVGSDKADVWWREEREGNRADIMVAWRQCFPTVMQNVLSTNNSYLIKAILCSNDILLWN